MKTIVVTGAAGFIGSNIVRGLNARGERKIVAVDNLKRGDKYRNLARLELADYCDKHEFLAKLVDGKFGKVDTVFHQGACSDTMEQDGQYMMQNNFAYSRDLLRYCQAAGTKLLYASSAAVYGASSVFSEDPANEKPLNVYGYSKLLFDQLVRQEVFAQGKPGTMVAGLRYFNVYGAGEQHKGRMASVAFHNAQQFKAGGKLSLFGGYDGYAAGEQSRDFVWVEDVVRVNLWLWENQRSGIFNCGTGRAEPFNNVARAVINTLSQQNASIAELAASGQLAYVDFPDALKGKYQSYTCADIGALREAGYTAAFASVQEGTSAYMRQLQEA